MNDFVGYLLNLDEPADRARVEDQLRADPEAARTVEALSEALAPLEADREPPTPPADLAERTIARVAEHISLESLTRPLPAETGVGGDASPERWRRLMSRMDRADGGSSRWRRADFI